MTSEADIYQALWLPEEIAMNGKSTYRSYDNETGEKRYITEILVNEILLLGNSIQEK